MKKNQGIFLFPSIYPSASMMLLGLRLFAGSRIKKTGFLTGRFAVIIIRSLCFLQRAQNAVDISNAHKRAQSKNQHSQRRVLGRYQSGVRTIRLASRISRDGVALLHRVVCATFHIFGQNILFFHFSTIKKVFDK